MHLKGFTNPLSPEGRAALVEETPHHISADALLVTFHAGEDIAARYLPEPLEPVQGGAGYAYVADMLKVSDHEPDQAFLNPRRTQYGEGIIGFYCRYGERAGRFSAFIWVTEDWSMGFGQTMGWAKKMAQVNRTRINPLNPGMSPLGPGSRLSGTVQRHEATILKVGLEVEEREDELPKRGDRGFMLRYFPSVGPEIPEIRQLVSLKLQNVSSGNIYSGQPYLRFCSSDNEELEPLQQATPIRGYTYQQGWTTDSTVELLRDYNCEDTASPGMSM